MKKFNYLLLLSAIIMVFAASCGKDGAVGPAGPTGATGPQGAVGPAGPAGTNGQNGSIIYSGTTVPASSTGTVGDFYINLSTGLLYGPKTAGGWGTGFSLKGSAGATGAAGSKIYSGNGAPATSIGVVGDFYLDKTNYALYGPKVSAGWGTPLSLQGPEGNANVKTDVFTVTNSQWVWNSQYEFQTSPSSYTEYFTRYFDRSNNSITQDVLTNGLVLVYFTPNTSNNTNQWAPLPYEFTDGSGNFNYNIAYETTVGTVRFHYFFVQLNAAAAIPVLSTYTIATYQFKIVSVTGQAGIFMANHNVNYNNYFEVSKALGLWQQDKLKN